ncbi:acyl-CoA dehydrogenase family protein [Mycobacterium avium subsp. hominissuis]|uniref:Acyl-CoA dehydrogenase n=10 Tax=Mycobacterium avium complex (MAC) TaxID=120793 RepID=A0AAW5S046_MYCBC|nr:MULTISPECIES: acyl-CoA dehydrogenase family protein [Mycobacterium avium complex (MAC)]EUA38099.1 acyl-CoA dehydrogenase, C-terminal domain protein [Mycobacterium avium subsp. avium 2285 (R)]TXA41940.1 acyl-CoA dehydrogenase [Mycobacterium tuberculosis variant bovis]ABK64625.1 putative acyl-CoA dehydrogenase [Mycobacterium avium 104]ANR92196.1 acyl-CoA dehydrogenase [Mycobacterium avium]APA74541.1 acyl-CoA dehydrogenase family protein [Mycobacterium avium subsp. hominissuis]
MQLTFDADVEAFRAEFVAFLDAHLPAEAEALERPRSSSHVPEWARRWQRLLFDSGWLLPGNPPEFGGRNATLLQQYVYFEELGRRRIYQSFNPQGVGIIAASLLSFGTPEQKQRWAVPILRAEMTASLGMSEPGAGSDLASLKTRAVLDGDHFVVNGQKVWTSGAHDADVLLTFVRTDPNAPKHKGISVLLIPTDTPGVVRRPFASMCDIDEIDFNEVFFTDARVPAENLVGELNEGWRVATGSLGHERVMLWMGYVDLLHELSADFRPADALQRDRYATLVMDAHALRLLGSAALAAAARGEEDVPAQSVLKLLGSEALQRASEDALEAAGSAGLVRRAVTAQVAPLNLDSHYRSWFDRYARTFAATIAGGTSEIQRNIIAERVLGLPRN